MALRLPECNEDFYKYGRIVAIVTTVVFFCIGLTFLGVGLWFLLDPDMLCFIHVSELNARGDIGRAIAYCMCVVGGLLIIFTIVGLVGLILRHPHVLMSYMLALMIISVLQLATAILALINSGWLGDRLYGGMFAHMRDSYMDLPSGMDDSWNRMQIQLRCCGTVSRDDWVNSSSVWYQTVGVARSWNWPTSCCYLRIRAPGEDIIDEIGCQRGDRGSMHIRGCYTELKDWLYTWSVAIGVSLLLLVLFMVGLFVVGVNLWKEWYENWNKVIPVRPVVRHPQYGEMDGGYMKNSRPLPKHIYDKEITPVYS